MKNKENIFSLLISLTSHKAKGILFWTRNDT